MLSLAVLVSTALGDSPAEGLADATAVANVGYESAASSPPADGAAASTFLLESPAATTSFQKHSSADNLLAILTAAWKYALVFGIGVGTGRFWAAQQVNVLASNNKSGVKPWLWRLIAKAKNCPFERDLEGDDYKVMTTNSFMK